MGHASSAEWLKDVGFDAPLDEKTCAKIWAQYDLNHDGLLDRHEATRFIHDWCQSHNVQPTKEQVDNFFETFDKNKDGKISRADVVGEHKLEPSEVNEAILKAMAKSLNKGVPGLFFGEEAVRTGEDGFKDRETVLKEQLADHEAFEAQNIPSVEFEEIAPTMDTGDIILLSGQYGVSHYTKLVQGSQHSHCGVIVKLDGVLHLWESTQCTTADTWTGIIRGGPSLHNLRDRLRKYYGYMVYRPLRWSQPVDLQERIKRIREHSQDSFYDTNVWEGLKAFLNINGRPDNRAFFCSEFVAYIYQELGVISWDRAANTFFPADFSSTGGGLAIRHGTPEANKAKLLFGATFGAERMLVPPWPHSLKTMLLEEYLQLTGVSVSRITLMELADCNVMCEVVSIEGFELDRYGRRLHNANPRVFVAVGIVPEEQRVLTEYAQEEVKVGQRLSLPGIENHPSLSLWFIIKEGDLGKAVIGASYMSSLSLPTTVPSVPHVFRARTGNVYAKVWISKEAQPEGALSPRMKALRLASELHTTEQQAARVVREGLPGLDSSRDLLSLDKQASMGALVD
jgi:Ca2+-binding EF-hand superfamily protein